MLPFGVTIPATVPQRSEIPEGLTNYPVVKIFVKGGYFSFFKVMWAVEKRKIQPVNSSSM
jgi:hypothetical protein